MGLISKYSFNPGQRTLQVQWLFCIVISIVLLFATCWPDCLAQFQYDRSALAGGEWWRVLTAHIVHLNIPHLILNLLGLFLLCELLWGTLPLHHGIGLFIFTGMVISAALWWLQPELIRYAGLSGVLHGLWAGFTIYGLLHTSLHSRIPYLIGALLQLAKLLTEFFYGPSPYTENLIGSEVSTASHLYGAIAGMMYMLIFAVLEYTFLSEGRCSRNNCQARKAVNEATAPIHSP
jgi:rhomboid family GlyGly-CTERM serine protease